MRILVLTILILLTSGCAHYLYQGDFKAENNLNETSQFRLWWTKTDPVVGSDKAGPIILNVACGAPVTFSESDNGIVFVEGSDKFESVNGGTGSTLVCGKITNLDRFVDYSGGDILLSSFCKPIQDDEGFGLVRSILLSTEQPTYRIPITVKKEWSFLDSALSAPGLGCL